MPPQLVEAGGSKSKWIWRFNLKKSETYWEEWFQGLSDRFLSIPSAKLLILAGTILNILKTKAIFNRNLTVFRLDFFFFSTFHLSIFYSLQLHPL